MTNYFGPCASSNMTLLYETGVLADITVHVIGETGTLTLKLHKFALMTASNVFRQFFSSKCGANMTEISFDNIDFELVDILFRYMYGCYIPRSGPTTVSYYQGTKNPENSTSVSYEEYQRLFVYCKFFEVELNHLCFYVYDMPQLILCVYEMQRNSLPLMYKVENEWSLSVITDNSNESECEKIAELLYFDSLSITFDINNEPSVLYTQYGKTFTNDHRNNWGSKTFPEIMFLGGCV